MSRGATMPLSVGLVEGAARCEEGSTKVCCGVEKCADGVGSEKYVGWSTKVCCGSARCGDGVAGVTNGCRKGWKLAGSG